MTRYLIRRIVSILPIWIGIALIAFILAQLAPGDPAQLQAQVMLGRPPTVEEVQVERARMGLDRPAPLRFANWLVDSARGDLGISYRSGSPVTQELRSRLPKTMLLATVALGVGLLVAIPVGVLSALHRGRLLDHVMRSSSLAFASMPSYWLGYLLILLFAVELNWLPVAGSNRPEHLILPALTLGLGGAALLIRLTRSEVLEVLHTDYVRTARAKGVTEKTVLIRHALRNALLPVMTMVGLQFAGLLSGAVIVETIFAWPGVGRLAVDSINQRDYPMVQAFVVLSGTIFIVVNLIVDVLYAWADPRIRFGGTS